MAKDKPQPPDIKRSGAKRELKRTIMGKNVWNPQKAQPSNIAGGLDPKQTLKPYQDRRVATWRNVGHGNVRRFAILLCICKCCTKQQTDKRVREFPQRSITRYQKGGPKTLQKLKWGVLHQNPGYCLFFRHTNQQSRTNPDNIL